jgi:ketosteroid isomerase-like protein
MRPTTGQPSGTLAIVQAYLDAVNRHDVDAIMVAMTDDCVFESTVPPPDGERFEGQAAVRAATEAIFRNAPDAGFETEELFAAGDRCVVRWLYRWAPDGAGQPGHVRGVDVYRLQDGLIAEKLSYVKG